MSLNILKLSKWLCAQEKWGRGEISERLTPKPPTMIAVKRRANRKRSEEEKAAGVHARKTIEARTRAKSQNWNYEDVSDSASEYEPLRIS